MTLRLVGKEPDEAKVQRVAAAMKKAMRRSPDTTTDYFNRMAAAAIAELEGQQK